MTTAEKTQTARVLTPLELAAIVKVFREARKWSQEQLSEISKLSSRTIQRVEDGQASSVDTRRALAIAFGVEDVDVFNKPHTIPTDEELKAQKEAFERDHVTLKAYPVSGGRELARLVSSHVMDYSETTFELPPEAAEHYARLIDYYREFRDCADLYSETDKLRVYDEFQSALGAMGQLGVSLCYATRKVTLKHSPEAKPWTESALYVFACQKGQEPEEIVTPREVKIG